MEALHDPARHEPLSGRAWSAGRARDAAARLGRDAEQAFAGDRLWPLHPGDDEPGTPADGRLRGIYLGAAGMLHALSRLAAGGHHEPRLDLAAIGDGLHEPSLASPDEPGAGASLLVGSAGILLVAHRLRPSPALAADLAAAIAANGEHPSNELLLGAPGTMLAARAMFERTGQERFAALWRASARTLLARRHADGLWTQDLYGERLRYVGAAHGFAGNIRALQGGRDWLDDPVGVHTAAVAAARRLAVADSGMANWPPLSTGSRTGAPPRVQWCHGAPGIITSLALLGPDAELDELLTAGGELVWAAGPPAGRPGLCHGTAGNGFALLALLQRTGDERWLARARAFAMHALQQVERQRARTGRGRYCLYTGDVGAALLAGACRDADPRFPAIDDLA